MHSACSNIIENTEIFNMPLNDAFLALLKHRYPSSVAKTEEEFFELDIEQSADYMCYSIQMSTMEFGSVRRDLFMVGSADQVRVISYHNRVDDDFFNINALERYSPQDVIVSLNDIKNMLEEFLFFYEENTGNDRDTSGHYYGHY